MPHDIQIANIEKWQNPADLPEFYVSASSLANRERLGVEDYHRWLWAAIKGHKGRQFNELGMISRASIRGPVVLLCHEDGPEWMRVIEKAIRWHQASCLQKWMQGLPSENRHQEGNQ